MSDEKEKSYKDRNVWLRGLFMLLFVFLMGIVKFVTLVVVAVQFLTLLFTAKKNDNLLKFGKSLSLYQYQIMLFLTYNSEVQPFPMAKWPESSADVSEHLDTSQACSREPESQEEVHSEADTLAEAPPEANDKPTA